MGTLTLLLLVITSSSSTEGARILGMLSGWARSHHRFLQPVMRALAEAGHDVVVYSPFPLHNPPINYTDVHLENIKTEGEELTKLFLKIAELPQRKCLDVIWHFYENNYREFMGDPTIRQLIKSKDKFDLIINEVFSGQEHTLILGHIFTVPVIGLQAFFTNNLVNSHLGNDLSLSHIPDTCFAFHDKMTFKDRLINSLFSLRGLYFHYTDQLTSLEQMMKQDFPDMPLLEEMTKRVSLMLVNDHLTADYAQPRPPNIVPVGGIHIQPTQPLPQDMKTFMDSALEGVVYYSMGSYVQDELQPKEYFDMHNNVFRHLKQRVIWKTNKKDIHGLPKNVMTVQWAPQQDILAHPNCVLFITHGGLLSQHEAVYFGVPVVGIPQFYDQHRNVRFYEERGVGVKVAADELTEETMTAAIREVLEKPSYRENMKKLSAIFRDRPLSPAESVVFWTEYVLRHDGAAHLRPASTELRWYQLVLLDVIAAVITTACLFLFTCILFVNCIFRVMRLNTQPLSTNKIS